MLIWNIDARAPSLRKPCRGALAILCLALAVLVWPAPSVFGAAPRTVSEALETALTKLATTREDPATKLEFLQATYAGANRKWDVQLRQGATIHRITVNQTGDVRAINREEQNQKRLTHWRAAPDMTHLPDLDALMILAENAVRGDGFQPTGVVRLKYEARSPYEKETAFAGQTQIFFAVNNGKEARVVTFRDKSFVSHEAGKLLVIEIPVIRAPAVPELDRAGSVIRLPELRSPHLQTYETADDHTLIRIDGDFLFDFDSDVPTSEAIKLLPSIAALLIEANPETIQIEGHTDSWGTPQYNDALSLRRAHAIKDRLHALGVPEDKMTAIGYGETRPIADEKTSDGLDDPEGRQRNRRVEVYF